MKTKIFAYCRTFVLKIIILSAVLIIGGGEALSLEDRYIFEVTARNNTSKVTTVMQVYALNSRDARENVSANGWTILSIQQTSYKKGVSIPIQIGDTPVQQINVASPITKPTDAGKPLALSDNDLITSILGTTPIPNDGLPAVSGGLPATPGSLNGGNGALPTTDNSGANAHLVSGDGSSPLGMDKDLLAMTPDPKNLKHIYTIYFNLGIVAPALDANSTELLRSMPATSTYYLFGHTDNIKVTPNSEYKDNFDLSFKRAEAIKQILMQHGINPANINTVGLGSLYPVIDNLKNPGGTVQNRRVELYEFRQNQ